MTADDWTFLITSTWCAAFLGCVFYLAQGHITLKAARAGALGPGNTARTDSLNAVRTRAQLNALAVALWVALPVLTYLLLPLVD